MKYTGNNSLAPTDDLVRFWRSKVKVGTGSRGGECIHVNAVEVHPVLELSWVRLLSQWGPSHGNLCC